MGRKRSFPPPEDGGHGRERELSGNRTGKTRRKPLVFIHMQVILNGKHLFALMSRALFSSVLACVPVLLHAQPVPELAVQAVPHSVNIWSGEGRFHEEEIVPHLTMHMVFRCASPWKIACVHLGKTRLDVYDSLGSRPPGVQLFHQTSMTGRWPVMPLFPGLSVVGSNWTPGRDARWVEVRGTASVTVSSTDRNSEVVSVPLEKGAGAPVTLEKAALNNGKEEDVHTELTVSDWGFSMPGQKDNIWVALSLVLPDGSGACGLAWLGEGSAEERGYEPLLPGDFENGKSAWTAFIVLKRPENNQLNFRIRYASGLKETEIPVSFRIGMAGMAPPAEKRAEVVK